ncbi:hypothetical protein [Rosenbergiella nectarea]|uniref:hypothetical protein n=1 Tax=Rosenbergiella nectarea TaxID=988801 RepID=UPI001F4D894F|nr:hypothetical protein [Rosenbergiella nectarea]
MCHIDKATVARMNLNSIITVYIWEALLGVATKKMRAITSNHQGEFLEVVFFFDSKLTQEEDAEMRKINNSIIYNVMPAVYNSEGEPIITVKEVDLTFIIIPSDMDILDKRMNIGWHYLRKEYL